jgi:hypothetical protein
LFAGKESNKHFGSKAQISEKSKNKLSEAEWIDYGETKIDQVPALIKLNGINLAPTQARRPRP